MWRRWFFQGVLVALYVCFVAGQSPTLALRGKKVILKPGIVGRPTTILWKHNGNKVVEFNGHEEHKYGTYENRVTVDWHTADLEISDLRLDDSGSYELEVEVNKNLYEIMDKLEVIEEITEASITCALNNGDDSTKSATLSCAAKPEHAHKLSTFTWTSHGKVEPGQDLKISLGGEHDAKEYVCNVSNPLSTKADTFTAKECYTDKSSTQLITILVSVFLIILVLVAVGLLYICKLRRMACFDVESSKKGSRPQSESVEKTNEANESSRLIPCEPTTPAAQEPDQSDPDSETYRVDDRPQKGVDELIGQFGGGGALHKKPPPPQQDAKFKGKKLQQEFNKQAAKDDKIRLPLDQRPSIQPLDHLQNNTEKDLENDIDKHEEHKSVEETNEANERSRLIPSEPTTPAAQEPDQSDPAENYTDEYKDAASTPPSPRSESPPRPSDFLSEKDDKPDPDTESPPKMSNAPEQPEENKLKHQRNLIPPHSALASNDPAGLDKENNTDEHDEVPPSRSESPPRPSDSEKDDKPDPDTETPPEMSNAPEQPASETVIVTMTPHREEEKKEEVNSPPAKVTPPVPPPRSWIAAQNVTGEEDKEEANLGPMKGQSDLLAEGKTNESDGSLNYEQKNSDTPEPAEESADTSCHNGDDEPDLYLDNTDASQESQHPAHEGKDDDKQEAKVNTSCEPDTSSNDEDESTAAKNQPGPKEEKTGQ